MINLLDIDRGIKVEFKVLANFKTLHEKPKVQFYSIYDPMGLI